MTIELSLSQQHLLRGFSLRGQLTPVNSHQLEQQDMVWLHDQDAPGVHAFLHQITIHLYLRRIDRERAGKWDTENTPLGKATSTFN
jgi:hypothetical protein